MKYICIVLGVFCTPLFAHASVRITEIAWMGIEGKNGQYGEWIELYNDSEEPVSLSGWHIQKTGEKPLASLTKTIPGKGYMLIERKTASVPDPIPSIEGELLTFGSSGLSNEGEDITLLNAEGVIMQTLLYGTKWPAGNAQTKETMQWDGDTWVTGIPTPAQSYSIEEDDGGEEEEEIEEGEETPLPKPSKPYVRFMFPELVYRGVSYTFQIQPTLEYNFHVEDGLFLWNMGDGVTHSQEKLTPITHTYRYPGTYTVSFEYHDPTSVINPVLTDTQTIEVLVPSITITLVEDAAIEIKNDSGKILDLSGWKIHSGISFATLPKQTVLGSRATIALPLDVLGFTSVGAMSLRDPMGRIISEPAEEGEVKGVEAIVGLVDTPKLPTTDAPLFTPMQVSAETIETKGVYKDAVTAPSSAQKTMNRTKTIVFSAVGIVGIGLFLLLQRFKA